MSKECIESSMATTSSTPPNWWDLPAWNPTNPWSQPNPNSNSSYEEDISISSSFTNTSNHLGLTVESSHGVIEHNSSHDQLMGETAPDNHLWNHVLLNVGNNGGFHNQDVRENLLDELSSKNMQNGIFEPAYDYLKKLENSWEFTNTSFNNFEKNLNGLSESLIENERLTKLSNLVSNWSIAPPEPNNLCHSTSFPIETGRNSGLFSCYGHDLKVDDDDHCDRSFVANENGYQIGVNSSVVGDNSKYYYGMPISSCTSTRSFEDVISFNNQLTKPLIDIHMPKTCLKSLSSSNFKKQELQTSSMTRNFGRGLANTNVGKKKRCEEMSESVTKKSKHESSTISSLKPPKVKFVDRITPLQQMVSPFGKTDTASVLYEAIGYIKWLQEQVQLLSNPYMKTNSHKDIWDGIERKQKRELKVDLMSRGLCIVPISCVPEVYKDNNGSDFWTPTYRGCLYR